MALSDPVPPSGGTRDETEPPEAPAEPRAVRAVGDAVTAAAPSTVPESGDDLGLPLPGGGTIGTMGREMGGGMSGIPAPPRGSDVGEYTEGGYGAADGTAGTRDPDAAN